MEPRRKMPMISTVVLLVYFTTDNVLNDLGVIASTTWQSKMSSGIDNPKQNQHQLVHLAKEDKVSLEEMQGRFNLPSLFFTKEMAEINEKAKRLNEENNRLQEKIETLKRENEALKEKVKEMEDQNQKQEIPSLYLAKEIGEINEKANGLNEENNRLREKIKTLKKENEVLKEKVKEMEDQNQKQEKTISSLEASYDKLQKELAKVKTNEDRLRIEIEEKTSKFSAENKILTEKLEALTKDFEEVERENNELKRRLELLTNSNNSLKQTVDLVKIENQELKDDMEKIRKKLEYKETILDLGQVPFLLEQEIWKTVFPDEDPGKVAIFQSMERELEKNGSSPEGKAAQERWNNLKSELKWDDENHKFALKLLKKLRLPVAHPKDVDLVQAKKQLKEGKYVAVRNKKSCEEIIEMIETLRKLNT